MVNASLEIDERLKTDRKLEQTGSDIDIDRMLADGPISDPMAVRNGTEILIGCRKHYMIVDRGVPCK
jgi:hypothetical protein